MSGFTADWLALREPADTAARSPRVTDAVARVLASNHALSILDLGAGTGANARYLVGRLRADQRWLLVDHDLWLLDCIPEQMASWALPRGYTIDRQAAGVVLRRPHLMCHVTMGRVDLDAGDLGDELFAGRHLITASALLDLVSEPWMQMLALKCARHRAAVLFALTYDGRIECSPGEAEDEIVRALVNRHQKTDKGFGAALGSDASDKVQACFTGVGYDTRRESSDWILTPDLSELQRQLIEGWVGAAVAIAPERAALIESWRARRLAHVDAHRSEIVVGHTDFAAWPARSLT